MEENKLNYKKDESVYLPSDDGSYSIRKFDWNRIKRIVDTTEKKKPIDFKLVYSILYGVGGSAGVSILPVYYAEDLPPWVTPSYIICAFFSIGVALVLTIMDKKIKSNSEQNISEIKTEMEEVEKLFPKPQSQFEHLPKMLNSLKIIKATYHSTEKSIDITKALSAMIIENRLDIVASNDIAGDPHIGHKKELDIEYEFNGITKTKSVNEGDTLIIEN